MSGKHKTKNILSKISTGQDVFLYINRTTNQKLTAQYLRNNYHQSKYNHTHTFCTF